MKSNRKGLFWPRSKNRSCHFSSAISYWWRRSASAATIKRNERTSVHIKESITGLTIKDLLPPEKDKLFAREQCECRRADTQPYRIIIIHIFLKTKRTRIAPNVHIIKIWINQHLQFIGGDLPQSYEGR